MNGNENNGHHLDHTQPEEAFTDVKLEVPENLPEHYQDRGERVKGEIAMLSPMQHPSVPTQNTADKSRPEDLQIKSFVSNKPLPIPTPSR